jgi:hypothetical protein
LGGEGELRAVSGETREDGVAGGVGQAAGGATVRGNGVKLAGVGEDNGFTVDGGESQEAGGRWIGESLCAEAKDGEEGSGKKPEWGSHFPT